MKAQQNQDNRITTELDQARGCTRITLRVQATMDNPATTVTARVIPERHLGTWRVVVTAGANMAKRRGGQSLDTTVRTIHELCLNNIADEDSAMSWARECVRGAEAFWRDVMA